MIERPVAWSVLAVGACLAAGAAAARETGPYGETIEVNVVNVEVVVTGADGMPVTGLARDDFELFEDGERIELTNFYAATRPPAPGVGDDTPPAAAPRPGDATEVLNLVVFVDQLNLGPQHRKLLFDELREELPRQTGDDARVMVAVMGGRFEVPLQFTDDLASVFAVLDEQQKVNSLVTGFEAQRRQYLNSLERASVRRLTPQRSLVLTDPLTGERNAAETEGDFDFDAAVRDAMELAVTARTLAEGRTQRVRASVQVLAGLCEQLGSLPGRKALLYLSDGLPLRPGESLLEAWVAKFESWAIQNEGEIRGRSRIPGAADEFRRISSALGLGELDLSKDFERLTERASDARVAFYPITRSSGNEGVAAGERESVTGSGGAARAAQRAESFSREAALMQLADDTGGVAMLGIADVEGQLARIRRDFESFYSLGYSPLRTDDGFRRLKVEVRRSGVDVRHVKGYRNARPARGTRVAADVFASAAGSGTVDVSEAAVSEVIDVRVADVEVVVTDASGEPIEGLTRADFEIYEDGRRMELTNFYAVERRAEASAPESAPESVPGAASPPVPPEGAATRDPHLVIYVDNLNIQPQNRKLLFASLREYLRRHHGRPVMLVTMNRRVEVALPFTRDRERVFASLDEIERQGSPHMLSEGARRMFLSRLERADLRRYNPSGSSEGDRDFNDAVRVALDMAQSVRALAEERYQKAEATLEALGWLCDSLGGLAGRKALVYLSDGLPLRPADSLIQAWTDKYEAWVVASEDDIRRRSGLPRAADDFQRLMSSIGSSQFDLQSELNRLTVRASDNQVAFYPISNSGRATSYVSAERMGNVGMSAGGSRRGAMATESLTRDTALLRMAEDTGGVAALRNANLGRLLEQVDRDFSSFYSLGYTPPADRRAVSFHKLEVKVRRPGARVRHVKGYRDKNWRQRLGEMTAAAALFAVESNPLEIQVAPGEAVAVEGEGFRVPLMVKIPFQRIRLVHRDRHFNAQLTVLVMVRDERDALSSTRRFDLPIKIPDSRVLEVLPQVAAYPLELSMPGGEKRLAVGVRDHLAQTEATVKYDLTVAPGAATAEPAEPIR